MQKSCLVLLVCVVCTLADCPNAWRAALNAQMEESTSNGCEADWKFFKRPAGGWCMKVFADFAGSMDDAEKKCKAVDATLSGFQNKNEALFVQGAILAQVTPSSGSLWTGIQRTKKCIGQKLTATCSNLTSFEWTDAFTTGTDGFVFQAGQPDNKGLDQNCALFLASKTPSVIANKGTYYAASYEDTGCTVGVVAPESMTRQILGYVCGKKAVSK